MAGSTISRAPRRCYTTHPRSLLSAKRHSPCDSAPRGCRILKLVSLSKECTASSVVVVVVARSAHSMGTLHMLLNSRALLGECSLLARGSRTNVLTIF
ncbi:uncharacterized protein LAESUDRAFT_480038 [Laetiporus sulphureus 93-53]|uniref:Uncharacterized protein n=1 Tax=Laetiporus sulphureus 93-53 TaxID=1314785 RepID=A0A165BNH0_9APHY|nr:uncharacterized protein LAESUDRAFT_480038 [Laetiporus sulphureus 93-53]KZT01365.1 hypothetical protein LAESUDRAFT_480038 [Laetiporus sulphureus 93-53]